jgi:hypothetical protein
MKLSRKSDYALRALFTLVEHYGEGPKSIREIAERNDIPRRFLEQIMLDMKAQKWVESIAGRDGERSRFSRGGCSMRTSTRPTSGRRSRANGRRSTNTASVPSS